MNREKKPCIPLKIIKVLSDYTHLDEKWAPAGEREIVILVSDSNMKKFILEYNMNISQEGNLRLDTSVSVSSYVVKDVDVRSINIENWRECVIQDTWTILSTYCDWEIMYDELWIMDIEKNMYHIDWQDFFKKSPLWNNLNIADLHMHSECSDGTDWLISLVRNLRENGISIFSVTDHDTIDFYKSIKERNTYLLDGMRLIPGIEFSCKTEHGKCHILGYGIDVDNIILTNTIMMTRALRNKKMINRLQFLEKQYGIVLDVEDKKYLAEQNSVGKPHIANVLVKKGLAENINDAISKFLSNIPNDEDDKIDAQIAIDAIVAVGGIPVWAHPLGGIGEKRLSEEQFTDQLRCLVSKGIQGLEMYYSLYSQTDRKLMSSVLLKNKYADKLCLSGGSDYHGRNKTVKPGELCSDDRCILGNQLSVLTKLDFEDNRHETCSLEQTRFLCNKVVFALGKKVNSMLNDKDIHKANRNRYEFIHSVFKNSHLFCERKFYEANIDGKWYYSENGMVNVSLCEDKDYGVVTQTKVTRLTDKFINDIVSAFEEALGYRPKYETQNIMNVVQTITLTDE